MYGEVEGYGLSKAAQVSFHLDRSGVRALFTVKTIPERTSLMPREVFSMCCHSIFALLVQSDFAIALITSGSDVTKL